MRRIFTFTSLAIALALSNVNAHAQTTTGTGGGTVQCSGTSVEEGFSNPTTAFTSSDFTFSAANGRMQATYGSGINTITQSLRSGSYTLGVSNSVNVGFTLERPSGGSYFIQSASVTLYRTNNTAVATATYNNSSSTALAANTATWYCFSFAGYSGIVAGQGYYFVIDITFDPANNTALYFDNFAFTSTGSAPLPVDFKSVSVKSTGSGNQITWNVADEINVAGYDLEKSTDARSFVKVATVKASNLSSYSALDLKASGKTYYRVKSTDIDGKYKYSYIVSSENGNKAMLQAFPSPALSVITINHTATESGRIAISSVNGQVVKTISAGTGSVQTKVDISSLKPGMYMISFTNANGEVENTKFIKQ